MSWRDVCGVRLYEGDSLTGLGLFVGAFGIFCAAVTILGLVWAVKSAYEGIRGDWAALLVAFLSLAGAVAFAGLTYMCFDSATCYLGVS